jgi:hypothetical protein
LEGETTHTAWYLISPFFPPLRKESRLKSETCILKLLREHTCSDEKIAISDGGHST